MVATSLTLVLHVLRRQVCVLMLRAGLYSSTMLSCQPGFLICLSGRSVGSPGASKIQRGLCVFCHWSVAAEGSQTASLGIRHSQMLAWLVGFLSLDQGLHMRV